MPVGRSAPAPVGWFVMMAFAAVATGCRSRSRAVPAAQAAQVAPAAQAVQVAPFTAVSPPTQVAPGRTFVIAAAGDVAGRFHNHRLTASLLLDLLASRHLAAILVLGDTQYPRGDYRDYLIDYAPSWGVPSLLAITRPVPGNHEYAEGFSDADGYFDFFNGRDALIGPAGERGLGYYSFDMGDWHFVALNTNSACSSLPCGPGSVMHSWLVEDLRVAGKRCVLAYFHHPRFQQGDYHHDSPQVAPLWDALYDARADLVLSGHDHNFQALAPLDKDGHADATRGLRSFVVGTGGARLYPRFDETVHADVMLGKQSKFPGVLELSLGPGAYEWRFLAATGERGGRAVFAGRDVCR